MQVGSRNHRIRGEVLSNDWLGALGNRHDGLMDQSALLPSEQARFDEVCRFGLERVEPLAVTVADAFADDPVWKWIYGADAPLPIERGMGLARYFVASKAAPHEIHGFRHHQAVALWEAPTDPRQPVTPEDEAAQAALFIEHAAPELGDRIGLASELSDVMQAHRPEEPHWYLSIVAVASARQGEGLGGRVIGAMHERCDATGVPCYLESSNPRNHSLYLRHGYVEVGEIRVADSPPLMGFSRQPRR